MLESNHLLQQAAVASSTYAAFTAAANMYQSFYPTMNMNTEPYFDSNEVKQARLEPNVSVTLDGVDLWKRFHSIGTEMIVTKNGRRLFPSFHITVSELDPDAKYTLLLDIIPTDDNRYKYQESAWMISGKGEPHMYGRYYVHPDSPQTGAQWMKQSINFNKVKITNNPMQNPHQILLNSMHRYIPRVHVVEASDDSTVRTGRSSTFVFDETAFIAVTAYQNDQIKNLKIDHNPFAKGFREPTHGKKNQSKSLKRLQTSLPVNKPTRSDEPHRLCKSDSSLLSTTSISPPLHNHLIHPDPIRDATPFNFPSIYPHYQQFPSYDPSYGYYPASIYAPPNNYNPSSYF